MRAPIRKAASAATILALLASLVGTPALAGLRSTPGPGAARGSASAAVPSETCSLSGSTRTCELWAKTGTIDLPGLSDLPILGYADAEAADAQMPGPTLVVNAGETVEITLHNELTEATSLAFPGQTGIAPDQVGADPSLSTVYSFTAAAPGTYLYEAGLTAGGPKQVAQGLYGALIVRPAGQASWAYDEATAFNQEELLVVSELDPDLNTDPDSFDMRDYHPTYWLFNGQAYPDTEALSAPAGSSVLLRYVNAGLENQSVGLLGGHETVIASGGHLLAYPYEVVAETIPAGDTLDAILALPNTVAAGTKIALLSAAGHLDNAGATTGGIIDFGGMLTFLTTTAPTNDIVGPATSNLLLSSNPAATTTVLTATADDTTTGGSAIDAAEWWDGSDPGEGSGTPLDPSDNAFDSPIESLTTTINVATMTLGGHTLGVRAHDAGGNWGPATSIVLTVDNQGPGLTALALTPSHTKTSVGVGVAATADDTSTGGSNVVAGEYVIDATCPSGSGTPMSLTGSPAVSAGLTATLTSNLTEGAHQVSVHARDALGNWGACTDAALSVDKTGPVTSSVAAAPNPTNSAASVTITATASDPVTPPTIGVQSNISAAEWFEGADPGVGLAHAMSAQDTSFNSPSEAVTGTAPVTGWSLGNHTISVRAKDAAGNWGGVSTTTLAVTDTIFADGFESGDTSAWSATSGPNLTVTLAAAIVGTRGLQVSLGGSTTARYVQDDTPVGEASYRARFYFNPHGALTGNGSHAIFMGRNGGGTSIFEVYFRRTNGGQYQLRAIVRGTNANNVNGNWYAITNASHHVEIAWTKGVSGSMRLYIDGTLKQTLTSNTNANTLESVRLGPTTGLTNTMSGSEYFDAFRSTHTSPIGP